MQSGIVAFSISFCKHKPVSCNGKLVMVLSHFLHYCCKRKQICFKGSNIVALFIVLQRQACLLYGERYCRTLYMIVVNMSESAGTVNIIDANTSDGV